MYFVFCLAQKSSRITEDNGLNYTENNGNALVKFTNPDMPLTRFRQKENTKNQILVTLVLYQQLVLLTYPLAQHLSQLTFKELFSTGFLRIIQSN